MDALRILAGVLALGGGLWGLFCLLFLAGTVAAGGNFLLVLVLFGPGYLVTAGYIVRFVWYLPLPWRQAIWIASAIVQGAWLIPVLLYFSSIHLDFDLTHPGVAVAFVTVGWWLFACVASIIAVFTERESPTEPV